MKTNPNKLWFVALALGWLFDYLFWEKSLGINFAIFWTVCLIAAFYLLMTDGLRPNRSSLILIPLFIFFVVVTILRDESMTTFLAYTFTLVTLTILTVTYLGGRWLQYTIVDGIVKLAGLVASMVARPILFSIDIRKSQAETGVKQAKFNFMPILRGLAIALPIVIVFASLLASADIVFGQRLDDFVELFKLEDLPEYIFRSIYILIAAYALAGIILHASTESKDEKLIGKDKTVIPPFLGFIESTIILGSVVTLFAIFVVIQFQYFFGGETNINVEGYTYAEYARKGFGELVVVAFFALLMLLTLSSITKRETEKQRKIYSGFGITLVLLLLVMLFSAFQRLNLYEAAYGFSRIRTYTHVFLIWLGLLLVATIVLEVLHKERLFAIAMLIASFGFAITLPILNVDAFIVNQNIKRELTQPDAVDLDSQYFIQLSDDAIFPLVNALNSSDLPDLVHEKVASSLVCIRYKREQVTSEYEWQSFRLTRYLADNALASVKSELDTYPIDKIDSWNPTVTTPSGIKYNCYVYYD